MKWGPLCCSLLYYNRKREWNYNQRCRVFGVYKTCFCISFYFSNNTFFIQNDDV